MCPAQCTPWSVSWRVVTALFTVLSVHGKLPSVMDVLREIEFCRSDSPFPVTSLCRMASLRTWDLSRCGVRSHLPFTPCESPCWGGLALVLRATVPERGSHVPVFLLPLYLIRRVVSSVTLKSPLVSWFIWFWSMWNIIWAFLVITIQKGTFRAVSFLHLHHLIPTHLL